MASIPCSAVAPNCKVSPGATWIAFVPYRYTTRPERNCSSFTPGCWKVTYGSASGRKEGHQIGFDEQVA